MKIDSLQSESQFTSSHLSTRALTPDPISLFNLRKSPKHSSIIPMEVDPISHRETPESKSTEDITLALLQKLVNQIDGPLQSFSKFVQILLDPSFLAGASMDESNRLKAQAEEAWLNIEEWRSAVSRDLKAFQQMEHIVDTSQRIAARFFDIAESLPDGQIPADLPEFLSAMKFILYLAVKMEVVKAGDDVPDAPVGSFPINITEMAMLAAFNAARNACLKTMRSDHSVKWKELISNAWSAMPADRTSVKAFYLGLADNLNEPIDPVIGPITSAAQNVSMKKHYLMKDNREELELFGLYSSALLGICATSKALDA